MRMKTKLCLAAAVLMGLVACQRESVEPVNPNYNTKTNEVVTNFVFNVSTSNTTTKQSADAVQALPTLNFRGISDAYLLTYSLANDGDNLAADADASKIFDLATVASPNTITATNSRRVLEMSLPIHTNTLLFYGKAPKGDAYGGYTNVKDCYGHMDSYVVDRTSGSADFQIGSRLTETEYTKFTIVENMFAGIQTLLLNHIVAGGTTITDTAHPSDVADKPYGFNVTIPEGGIKWKDYVKNDGTSPFETTHERYPLEDKLSYLYKRITTIRAASPDNEVRDGSGSATLFMAKDLLSVLNDIRRSEPISGAEAVAKYFANEVYTRMTTKYFKATSSEDGLVITGTSFQETSTIAEAFLAEQAMAYKPTGVPAGFFWPTLSQMKSVEAYDPAKFPLEFNIPLGASYIAFDDTKDCFYYPQSFNVSAMGMPTATYNAKNYFYPAELMYFGNSPVRVSSVDQKVSDYPNGSGMATGHWENDASWDSDWSEGQVGPSTRAVAMKEDIQYGTAMLSTQVQYATGVTQMSDNNHAIQKYWNPSLSDTEELDNTIDVDASSFLVTGIIIGGQPKAIGWDYLPLMGTTYGFIYDTAIPAAAQTIGSTTPNYTLVLDNFLATSQSGGIYTPGTQSKVYVAIEFKNNTGKDFYGNASLIRNGGYFYLVGCLDPAADGLDAITWPSDHAVPPYKADGTTNEVTRVFIQDFMTTAVFKLGANSLKSAYLTVPDLRSSTMSLGLSVDLNWETGLNFENIPLG